MGGNASPGQWLHIVAAVLADAGLPENPLGTVWAFAFLAGLGGKGSAVSWTELNIIGVGLVASGAGFHGRVCSSPVAGIITDVWPQRESGLEGGVQFLPALPFIFRMTPLPRQA